MKNGFILTMPINKINGLTPMNKLVQCQEEFQKEGTSMHLVEFWKHSLCWTCSRQSNHQCRPLLNPIRTCKRRSVCVILHWSIPSALFFNTIIEFELVAHPVYSPNLAISDYHLFRSMAYSLRGRHFTNIDVERLPRIFCI